MSQKTTTMISLIGLALMGSQIVLSKPDTPKGQPFEEIMTLLDDVKNSITSQLDGLLTAVTDSKQEMLGSVKESKEEIQDTVTSSETSIKDAVSQAENNIVTKITAAEDEISSKIDDIQYEGLTIKKTKYESFGLPRDHDHFTLRISFSRPSNIKAIFISPDGYGPSLNLHWNDAEIKLASSSEPYILDVTDYNPDPEEESKMNFELLNKFDLHEISVGPGDCFDIKFEASSVWNNYLGVNILFESTPDANCDMTLLHDSW